MEIFDLKEDIPLFYSQATSFPQGVEAAHEKLHSVLPTNERRRYFGISRPENGVIVYKAAAEELQAAEAEKYGFPRLVLKKGKYICETVKNYMKDPSVFGTTFQKLLSHPRLDPQGYCVEWYLDDKEAKCMIRLID